MKDIGYYPGCSLAGTAPEYDASLRSVAAALGINLIEIPDWSCCGASSAHITGHLLSVALPARNLVQAAKAGITEVLAPCAACYNRLVTADHKLKNDGELRRKIEEIIGEEYKAQVRILNMIQAIQEFGMEALQAKATKPLTGMKAACYYGCLLVRPAEIVQFDDAEMPESMEAILKILGAEPVQWNFKTECCGAAHSLTHRDIVVSLSKKILDDAAKNDASTVVTACPMCHSNLDMRQPRMLQSDASMKPLPVLYLTEAIGLALGLEPAKLGLDKHFIGAESVVRVKQTQEAAV